MSEKGLIRNLRLISKFMTFKPGKQTIAIHILCNISRSKGRQAMKFSQLIECNAKIFFFKNHVEKEVAKLVPDFFLFFGKVFYEVKASSQSLNSNIYR